MVSKGLVVVMESSIRMASLRDGSERQGSTRADAGIDQLTRPQAFQPRFPQAAGTKALALKGVQGRQNLLAHQVYVL